MSLPMNQPPLPQGAEGEMNYSFHRLMRRSENYRWWRPLAFTGIGIGFYGAALLIAILAMFIALIMNPLTWAAENPDDAPDQFLMDPTLNMATATDFSMTMVSLIIMIPAVYLAYLLIGPKPVGLLISVAGKLRWRWFGLTLGASAILFAVYFGLSFGLGALGIGESEPVPASSLPADPLFYALLVILLTPFQCAAEELVFRGAFMQVIGSWLKHPLFAILLPVPFFTIGHLYDVWGLLDVAAFAIAAGFLTWRTGGLEAAMAMHIINNTFLFLLGAMGAVDLNATESNPVSLVFSVCFMALLTFVLVKLADRQGIARTAGPIPAAERRPMLQPWQMSQPPVHPSQAYWAPPAYQPGQQQNSDHGSDVSPPAPPAAGPSDR